MRCRKKDLTATQCLLLAGSRDLLERVQPPRTRLDLTSLVTKPETNYFILEVEHDERDDLVVGVSLFEDQELMAYWGELAHDDFFIPSYSTTEEAIDDALGFVEQAICGRFEVDATLGGPHHQGNDLLDLRRRPPPEPRLHRHPALQPVPAEA